MLVAADETTYYTTSDANFSYKVTSVYYSSTKKTSTWAAITEVKSISSNVDIPTKVSYKDKYGASKTTDVQFINERLFSDYDEIRTVNIQAPISSTGCSFWNCTNLETVTLSSPVAVTVFHLTGKSFQKCDALKEFVVENNTAQNYSCNHGYLAFDYSEHSLISFPPASPETLITVQSDIRKVDDYAFLAPVNLKEIKVDENNSYLTAHEGSLYSTTNSTYGLIFVPNIASGEYTLPASVTTVSPCAFTAPTLKSIKADAANQNFTAEGGVLYSKDKTYLQGYPGGSAATTYVIPETVRQVNPLVFYSAKNLKTIIDSSTANISEALRYLDDETIVYTNQESVQKYREIHANTYSTIQLTDEVVNTASISGKLVLPQGLALDKATLYEGSYYDLGNVVADVTPDASGNFKVGNLLPQKTYTLDVKARTADGTIVPARYIFDTKAIGVELTGKTQTSLSFAFDLGDFKAYSELVMSVAYTDTRYQISGNKLQIKNLAPGVYRLGVLYKVNEQYGYGSEYANYETELLNPGLVVLETGPTTIDVNGRWVEGDAKIEGFWYTLNGKKVENTAMLKDRLTGLDPETDYKVNLVVKCAGKEYAGTVKSARTGILNFETLPAEATSNNCALIAASTNIQDEETGTGFEWRRYDAPSTMPSSSVVCPAYNGYLAGKLNGLSASTYYNYRPYYKSNSGNMYYGEWITFITADAYVYFEPVVYTFTPRIGDGIVDLVGYALAGSDKVTSQGFEYWMVSAPASVTSRAGDAPVVVTATGTDMNVRLTGLVAGATYRARAFAKTDADTTYGSEVEFEAPAFSGVENVMVGEAEIMGYYNLQGRFSDKPWRGINVVVYSDGTVRKVSM